MSDEVTSGGDPRTELAALSNATTAALASSLGGAVHLGEPELLRQRYRNKVARFPVLDGPEGAPATVVVKTVESEGEHGFDPDGDANGGPAFRFYNEWAGNLFLNTVGAAPPVNAGLFAADRDAGLIVLEDLGAPRSMADAMQQDDRAALEVALLQYAAGMGRLHAVTAGRRDEFEVVRRSIGGATRDVSTGADMTWFKESVPYVGQVCAELGVPIPDGFHEEADAVLRVIGSEEEARPFLVFKPGDTCPDNHFLAEDGGVRFFDFEFAGFGHALVDAAYFYMPFPTCWCVNRLPEAMVARMEAAYRAEAALGCPAIGDDALFYPALAHACAMWAMQTLHGLDDAREKDGQWGISTVRQRYPVRLENFAAVAERAGVLPEMRSVARALAARLRALWLDTEPMPVYLAFRETKPVVTS